MEPIHYRIKRRTTGFPVFCGPFLAAGLENIGQTLEHRGSLEYSEVLLDLRMPQMELQSCLSQRRQTILDDVQIRPALQPKPPLSAKTVHAGSDKEA